MSVTVEKLRNKWKVRTNTGVIRNFFNEKEAQNYVKTFEPEKETLEIVENITYEEDSFVE